MASILYQSFLWLVGFAIAVSALLWARFLFRCVTGQQKPSDLVPLQPQQRPFWNIGDIFLMFLATLMMFALFTTIFVEMGLIQLADANGEAKPTLQSMLAGVAINSLAGIFSVALMITWLSFLNPNAIGDLGIIPTRQGVLFGLRASLWILPPVSVIAGLVSLIVPYEHPVLETLTASPSITLFLAMFVGTVLVAPFVEEFTFRVIMQGALQRFADSMAATTTDTTATDRQPSQELPAESPGVTERTSDLANPYRPPASDLIESQVDSPNKPAAHWAPTHYWPIVVSSLLFAGLHWGQGAAPIPLFVLALGLGYLYRQTGKMTAPLVVHMVLNGITMCAEFSRILSAS